MARQQLPHLGDHGGTADQLRRRLWQIRRRRGCRRRRLAGRPGFLRSAGMHGTRVQDLLVQPCGFGLGRRVELAPQRLHAELVLAQCGFPAPKPRVELHDDAMHRLLQRVQRQETKTGLDGRFGLVGLLLMREQSAQALDHQLVQTLALRRQPLLERALGEHQPSQQVTSIESSDLSECVRAAIGNQPLEPRHVHIDGRGVKGHARAVEEQARAGGPGQGLFDS